MTPAIKIAKKKKIKFRIHEYDHDPSAEAYGKEAADKLGVDPDCVYKTLVTADGKNLIVAIVPVMKRLDMKALAREAGVKKLAMADIKVVEKTTGYVVGGVSPLGQKKRLPTIIDSSAETYETIYVSGGRRGLEIELSPRDLSALLGAGFGSISR